MIWLHRLKRRLLHAWDVVICPYVVVVTAREEHEWGTDAVDIFVLAGKDPTMGNRWIESAIRSLRRA